MVLNCARSVLVRRRRAGTYDERQVAEVDDEAAAITQFRARFDVKLRNPLQPALGKYAHLGARQHGSDAEVLAQSEGCVRRPSAIEVDGHRVGESPIVKIELSNRPHQMVTL